jgi:hypothetical protein
VAETLGKRRAWLVGLYLGLAGLSRTTALFALPFFLWPYPGENAAVLEFPYVQPSQWGMGLFFVTPALVYAFRAPLRSPLVQACWLGVLCILVPVITYYGVGWIQFGFRYALDFVPFLMVLVALGLPRPMTLLSRVLVLVSVAVSLWGTLWLISWV